MKLQLISQCHPWAGADTRSAYPMSRYGHFSGINRKVQLKYQPQGAPAMGKSSDEDDMGN